MLIDWLTLHVPYAVMSPEQVGAVKGMGDRIQRYCPRTGEVVWETSAWESVRSDSHQIAVKAGADALRIHGSPARCMGDGDAVFGSVSAMDIRACAMAMVDFAFRSLAIGPCLAPVTAILCTRIDVTGSLRLESLAQVRQALAFLRGTEGGRYRVSQTAGDTVYWSHRSRLLAAKAYAKGPHLDYMLGKAGYTGRAYTAAELEQAARLLRLELRLGSQYLRERAQVRWYDMSVEYLKGLWVERFGKMVGDITVKEDKDLLERFVAGAKTPGQGRAAYATWCMIEANGWQWTRDLLAKATWHRHIAVMRAAGLGDADISAGKVVAIRRHALVLTPVQSWRELLAA